MNAPNIIVTMKCDTCGHVQEVTSAAARKGAEGTTHYWFGSRYDFCDKCDSGMPVLVPGSQREVINGQQVH